MSEIPKFDVNESINTIKNAGNVALNNVTEYFKTNNDYMYIILSLTIVFLILFLLLSWINYTLSLKQKGCDDLNKIYPDNILIEQKLL